MVVAGAIDVADLARGAASTRGQVGSGGGGRGTSGGHIGGGGGGGGGNGDAVLVAIIVVVAVVVAIGLVSSEGVRFDGYVAMSPEQPVHLRAANGQQATIPVADLSPGWVAGTVEAKVMDDEGFGLRRLDRLPLDRRGATFKLDSGTIAFDFAGATLAGPAMNVQAGYFFTRKLGLLANLGLGRRGGRRGAGAAARARSRAAGVSAGVGSGPPRRVRQRRNGDHRGARRADPDLRQRPLRRGRRARGAGSDLAPGAHAARRAAASPSSTRSGRRPVSSPRASPSTEGPTASP